MTVYAASSISFVGLGSGHGGCGESHSRPVVKGAPVKVWALDCPQCEDHLRHDPLWSATIAEIPETYDERIVREDWEKRGATDQQYIQAMALAKLAGLQVPESLLRVASGSSTAVVPAQIECPNGHGNPAGAKFCVECGTSMTGTSSTPPEPPAVPEPETGGWEHVGNSTPMTFTPDSEPVPTLPKGWEGFKLPELHALAAELGVKTFRSKAEQVAAIKAHLEA